LTEENEKLKYKVSDLEEDQLKLIDQLGVVCFIIYWRWMIGFKKEMILGLVILGSFRIRIW